MLVQKRQGTVIDSENDFHYEGPLEVLAMDDEGTPVSVKTIPVRYVKSTSIGSDRQQTGFMINGTDNMMKIEIIDSKK